jgi:asparagine synthase (glutamine-hydrolysing)
MCGICGVLNRTGAPVRSDRVLDMRDVMDYRGPDDAGLWTEREIGVGHRRLSVIDIHSGKQPLSNEDGRYQIVFNGEIYNYVELYALLNRIGGHQFKTHHSDTEVILHLYEEFGAACLDHLEGMFAFAIVDTLERSIFMARDAFGIKPLYYYSDRAEFVFASEIKSIQAYRGKNQDVDREALHDYLTYQYVLGEKTLFSGIKKVPPGHYVKITSDSTEVRQYWDIDPTIQVDRSEKETIETVSELLEQSIRLHLRADVPLGAHLSGGLDTSTIVALGSKQLGTSISTFTAGFAEGGVFDDTHWAKITSDKFGTDHHEIFPSASDFADIFRKLVWFMDEPAAGEGVFPQYYVSKVAAQHVKVVLGGQGADETLAGYVRYLLLLFERSLADAIHQNSDPNALALEAILPSLPLLEQYVPLMRRFFSSNLFQDPTDRYRCLIERIQRPANSLLQANYQLGDYQAAESFRNIFEKHEQAPLLNKVLYYETRAFLPALLHVEDRMSMACSIESRVPFLFRPLIEFIFSIKPNLKIRGGQTKWLLRQAMHDKIPAEVLNRKQKLGFPVPLAGWANGPLKSFVDDILNLNSDYQVFDESYLQNLRSEDSPYSRELWGAMNVLVWFDTFQS